MLTKEQNEFFTRVGPGTTPGELGDTQTLHNLHATGVVDNLCDEKDRVRADIDRDADHGDCDECWGECRF